MSVIADTIKPDAVIIDLALCASVAQAVSKRYALIVLDVLKDGRNGLLDFAPFDVGVIFSMADVMCVSD